MKDVNIESMAYQLVVRVENGKLKLQHGLYAIGVQSSGKC